MASAPAGPGMAAVPEVKVYYGKPMQLKPMHLEPMQLDVSRVLSCLYEKDVNFKPIDMFQGKPTPNLIELQVSTGVQVIGFEDGPIFLHDSRTICRYVAEKYADRGNKYLLGRDRLERASIEQWLKWEEQSFNPPSRELIFYIAFGPHTNNSAPDRALITQSERKLAKVLDIYEQRLSQSRYLAGDEFTLADLNHFPNSYYLATTGYRDYLFDKRTNVKRWWENISDRPSWTKVVELMTKDTGVEVQKEPIAIEKKASKSWKPSIEVKKDVASREKADKVVLVPPQTSFVIFVSPSTETAKHLSDTSQDVALTTPEKVSTSEQATKVAHPTKEINAARDARVQPASETPIPKVAKLSTQPSPTTTSTESVEPQYYTPQDVAAATQEKVPIFEQATKVAPPTKKIVGDRDARVQPTLEAPTPQQAKPSTQPSPTTTPSTESVEPRSKTPQDVTPMTPKKMPTSKETTKIVPLTKEISAAHEARVQPTLETTTPQAAKPSTHPSPPTASTESVEPRSDIAPDIAPITPKKVATSQQATKVSSPTKETVVAHKARVQPAIEDPTSQAAKLSKQPLPTTPSKESIEPRFDTLQDVVPTTLENVRISEQATKVAPPTEATTAAREARVQPTLEAPTPQAAKLSTQPSPTTPSTESAEVQSDTAQDVAPTILEKVPTSEQATKVAPQTKETVAARQDRVQPALEAPTSQAAKPSTQSSPITPSTKSVEIQFDTAQDVAPTTLEKVTISEQATKIAPPTKETAAALKAKIQPALEAPAPLAAKSSTQTSPTTPSTESFKSRVDTPQDIIPMTLENVPKSEQATKVAPPAKETTAAREGRVQQDLETPTPQAAKPFTQSSPITLSTESSEPRFDTPQDVAPSTVEKMPTSEQATKVVPPTQEIAATRETRVQPALEIQTPPTAKPFRQPSPTTPLTKSFEPRFDTSQDVAPTAKEKVSTYEEATKITHPTKKTAVGREAGVQPALEAPTAQATKPSIQTSPTTPSIESFKPRSDTPQEKEPTSEQITKEPPSTKETKDAREAILALEAPTSQVAKPSALPSSTTPSTKSLKPRFDTPQDVAPTTPEKVPAFEQPTKLAHPIKEIAAAPKAIVQQALEASTRQAVKPPTQPSPVTPTTESVKPQSDTPQDIASTTSEKMLTSKQDTKIAPPTKEIAATREARVQPPLEPPTPQEAKPSTHPSPTTPSTKNDEPRSDTQYVAPTAPKKLHTSEEATKVAPSTEKTAVPPRVIVQPALEATTPYAAKRDTTQDGAPTTPENEPIFERDTKIAHLTKEIAVAREARVQPPLEVPTVQITKPSTQPSPTTATESAERRSETPQDVAPTTPKKVPTSKQATKVSPPTKEIDVAREATIQPTLETPTTQAAKSSTQPSLITPSIENAKPRFDTPQDVAPTTPVNVPTSEQATKVAPPTEETVVAREAGEQPSLEAQNSKAAKPSTQPSSTTSTKSVEPQSDTPQDIIPTSRENMPTSEQATKEAPLTKKTTAARETRLQPPLEAPTPQTTKPTQPSSTTISTESVEPRSDTSQDVSPTTPKKVPTFEQDTKVAPPSKEIDSALEARVQSALEAPTPQATKLSTQPSPTTLLTKSTKPQSDTSQDVAPTTLEKVATYKQSTDVAPPTKETATAHEASALEAPTRQAGKPPTQPSPATLSIENAKLRFDTPQDVAPTTPVNVPTSKQATKVSPPTKETVAAREAGEQPSLEAQTSQTAKPTTKPLSTTSTKNVEPRYDTPQEIIPTFLKNVPTSEQATKEAPLTKKPITAQETRLQPLLEAPTPQTAKPIQPSPTTLSTKSIEPRSDTQQDVSPTTLKKVPTSEQDTKVTPPTKETNATLETRVQPALETPTPQAAKLSTQLSPTTPLTKNGEPRSDTSQDVAPTTLENDATNKKSTDVAPPTKETATIREASALEAPTHQVVKFPTQPSPATPSTESAKSRSDTPQDIAPTTPEKKPTSEQDTKVTPPTKEIAATHEARVQPPLEALTPQEAEPSTHPSPTTPSTKSFEPRSDTQYVTPTIPKIVRTSEEATKVAPTEKTTVAPKAIVQPALEARIPHAAKRDVAPTTPEKEPISKRETKEAPPTKEIAVAREARVQPPLEVPTVQTTKSSTQPSPTTATESAERRSKTPQDVATTTPKKVPTSDQATKITPSTKASGQPSLESPVPQAAKPSTQPSLTTPSIKSVKSRFETPKDVAPATPEMVPTSEQTTKVFPPTKEIAAAREAKVQPTLETPTSQAVKPSTEPSPITPSIENAKPQFDTPQDVAPTTPVNVPTSDQATKLAPPTKETVVAREVGEQPSLETQTSQTTKPSIQPSSTTTTENAKPRYDTPQDIIPTSPENVPTSEQATKEAPLTKKTVAARETRLQPPLEAPTPQTTKHTQPSPTTLSTKSVEPRSDTPQDVSPTTLKKVPTSEQDTKVAPPSKETDATLEARVQSILEAPTPQAAKLSTHPSPTTPLTKSVEPRSDTSQDVSPTTLEKVATYKQSNDVAPPTKETATARETSALEAPTRQEVKPPTQPSPATPSTESAKPRSDTPQDVAPTTPENKSTSEQDTKVAHPTKEIAATREARLQPPLEAPSPQEVEPSTHPSPTTPSTKSVEPRSDTPQYVTPTIPEKVHTFEEATKVAHPIEKTVVAPEAIVQPALEATTPHAAKRDTTQDVAPTSPEKEFISERDTKVAPPTKEIVVAREARVQPPLEVPTVQTTKPSTQSSSTTATESAERRSETTQDVAREAGEIVDAREAGEQPSLEAQTSQAAKPSTHLSPTTSTKSLKPRSDTPQDIIPTSPENVPTSEQATKEAPLNKKIVVARETRLQPPLKGPTPQTVKPTQPSPTTLSIESVEPRSDTPQDISPTTSKKVPISERDTKIAPPTKETDAPLEARVQPAFEAPTPQAAKLSTQPSPTTPLTKSVEPRSDTSQDVAPTTPEKVANKQSTDIAPLTKETTTAREASALEAPTGQAVKPPTQPSPATPSTKNAKTRSDTPQDVAPITPEKEPTSKQTTSSSQMTKRTKYTDNTTTEQVQAQEKSTPSLPLTDESKGKSSLSQTTTENKPSDMTIGKSAEAIVNFKESVQSTKQSSTQTTMRIESTDNTIPDKLTTETTVSSQMIARTEITDNTTTKHAQAPNKSKLPPPQTDESKAKSLAASQPIAERQPSKEPASLDTESNTQTSNNSKSTTAALSSGKTTTEAIQNSSSIQTKEPTISNGELSSYETSTSEMTKESLSTKKAHSQEAQKAGKSVASGMIGQTPSISETTGTRTQSGVANTTESTQSPNSNFGAKTDPSIDSDSKSDSSLQS